MNKGPPQAIHRVFVDKTPWARRNLHMNQNLNREPWFATIDILNTVEFRVNPVFSTLKDRLYQPAPCPAVQVSGVVTGDGGNAFGRCAVRDEWAIRQLYCRPPVDWSSLTTPMPRKA